MTAKALKMGRGRPRGFDLHQAVVTGQALFHEHGYGAVGLAALTQALGIKPPSFYAAFGSKAGFLEKVLERYEANSLPLGSILRENRPAVEAIAELLEAAAHSYSEKARETGCLILETVGACGDPEASTIARRFAEISRARLHAFLIITHPETAEPVCDSVRAVMWGMSAAARDGWNTDRLLSVARTASSGIAELLAQEQS